MLGGLKTCMIIFLSHRCPYLRLTGVRFGGEGSGGLGSRLFQPSHYSNSEKTRFIYHCSEKNFKKFFSASMVNKWSQIRIIIVTSSFYSFFVGFFLLFLLALIIRSIYFSKYILE